MGCGASNAAGTNPLQVPQPQPTQLNSNTIATLPAAHRIIQQQQYEINNRGMGMYQSLQQRQLQQQLQQNQTRQPMPLTIINTAFRHGRPISKVQYYL